MDADFSSGQGDRGAPRRRSSATPHKEAATVNAEMAEKPHSRPYLSIPIDDELLRREVFQPHRPERMQLRRRDADLRPEPQLVSVGKPRRGVDEDDTGVDLADEALGARVVG